MHNISFVAIVASMGISLNGTLQKLIKCRYVYCVCCVTNYITLFSVQLTCAGAVVAAGFTVNEVVKLHNNSTLVERINEVNGNILTRLMATVSLALAAGLVIPLGIIMILLSLCKMKVECCTKCLAIVVG